MYINRVVVLNSNYETKLYYFIRPEEITDWSESEYYEKYM